MPEVRRGSARVDSLQTTNSLPNAPERHESLNHLVQETSLAQADRTSQNTHSGQQEHRPTVQFKTRSADQIPAKSQKSQNGPQRRHSIDPGHANATFDSRRSLSYSQRPEAAAYYDSRAATRREYTRRAKNLQEYYEDNPHLLPQLPFTWHHGRRRYRLWFFAFVCFVDASAVPIALYYGLAYAGNVQGWIIFAVVTTIWGGPTYLELARRSWRLFKKERFFRPLGAESRWSFDMTNWASILTVFVVTVLFIVGSAPHHPWLRVLCMPAPSILYCYGGWLLLFQLYHHYKWPAPFRLSSTKKGEPVWVPNPELR